MLEDDESSRVDDPEMMRAFSELSDIILQQFPQARIWVSEITDPVSGISLNVEVDTDNSGDVMDLILDRLVEYAVTDGLHIYPLITRPAARNIEAFQRRNEAERRIVG